MRRNDYLLCLVIITAALCGFWYSGSTAADSNAVVRITRHHELILQQTLRDFPDQYLLPTEHGSLTITKANSSLRVSEAPCPDKLCEKQGPITGSGSIVCIPEGVIIEIITSKKETLLMRSSTDTTTKTMLVLALLAALAVLLRLGENLLPLPVQLGVIRPGLANTITILCLYLFGLRLTGLFLTARVLLVGLLSTGLFTPGFLIGLGGTLLSLLLMEAGRRSQLFSPYGIGILGAAAHNTGQILTASLIMQSFSLFSLLPLLLLLSLPFGLLTGAVAAKTLPFLKQYLH